MAGDEFSTGKKIWQDTSFPGGHEIFFSLFSRNFERKRLNIRPVKVVPY